MFCIHCGKQIEENNTFCSHCGGRLDQAQGVTTPMARAQQAKIKKPFFISIAVLLIVALGFGGFSLVQNLFSPKVGDIIEFGRYEWRVLEVKNGQALILSEYIIEKQAYYHANNDITWENCSLRTYLNGQFYNSFSVSEQKRIAETAIINSNNPWYGTNGGNATNDKIFLLNLEEVVQYFGDSGDLENHKGWDSATTEWLLNDGGLADSNEWVLSGDGQGSVISDDYNLARAAIDRAGTPCWWWLRSPGHINCTAAYVTTGGRLRILGNNFISDFYQLVEGGVRPALWLKL